MSLKLIKLTTPGSESDEEEDEITTSKENSQRLQFSRIKDPLNLKSSSKNSEITQK